MTYYTRGCASPLTVGTRARLLRLVDDDDQHARGTLQQHYLSVASFRVYRANTVTVYQMSGNLLAGCKRRSFYLLIFFSFWHNKFIYGLVVVADRGYRARGYAGIHYFNMGFL